MKTKAEIEQYIEENKAVIAELEKALRLADDIKSGMLLSDIRMLKKENYILGWVLK